ncbi:MAG: DUF5063 domain-containing protein [Myxococcota bacterium]
MHESVGRFVELARMYCAFVEKAHTAAPAALLRDTARHLASLYAAALQLPDLGSSDDADPPDVPTPRWPGFAEHETYWEIFDPAKEDKAVVGSLTDDVMDVYSDVKSGLLLLEDRKPSAVANAVWHWRFTLATHWGDHAVDALRALQRALHRASRQRA